MRDYTAKFVDIGLDVEKHTLAGTTLSAERIHLISETENLLSDKLYNVFIHSSLCYFGSFYDWHQRKKFPFRLPNLNIILKYTHEPKQLYKQFLFCCKTVRVFLNRSDFLSQNVESCQTLQHSTLESLPLHK